MHLICLKAGLFVPAELCIEIKITLSCLTASFPGRGQDEALTDQGSLRLVPPYWWHQWAEGHAKRMPASLYTYSYADTGARHLYR